MRLGWVDRIERRTAHCLPRLPGEDRAHYTARFLRELRGLGNVAIVTVRGTRIKTRALRGL